jgi:hypothetical protein
MQDPITSGGLVSKKTTGNGQKAQGMKYEAHFVTHEHETGTSAPGSNGAGPSETEIPH